MPFTHRTAPGRTGAASKVGAFSLIEVVVAVGIFAIGIVAVIGLLSPTIKSVTNVTDSTVANRLADNIQLELQRIGFSNIVPDSTSATKVALPLTLVASRDGSRVLLAAAGTVTTGLPADDDTTATDKPPGILHRDRYYGITVDRLTTDTTSPLYYTNGSGSGFFALSVKIVWPYQVPIGAAGATTSPTAESASTYSPVSGTGAVQPSQQSSMLLNMALNP